jgi:hypothetical protein
MQQKVRDRHRSMLCLDTEQLDYRQDNYSEHVIPSVQHTSALSECITLYENTYIYPYVHVCIIEQNTRAWLVVRTGVYLANYEIQERIQDSSIYSIVGGLNLGDLSDELRRPFKINLEVIAVIPYRSTERSRIWNFDFHVINWHTNLTNRPRGGLKPLSVTTDTQL